MVLSLDRWVGKVAIVTGASVGIGAAIAETLVEEGLIVVGLARRSEIVEENAKKLQNKKGKLHAFKADISKEEDILKAFKWVTETFGPVHILINNAGIADGTTNLTNGETEKWKAVLDTNVLGLCIATREAVKIMEKNQIDGHIVHINSVAGHRVTFLPNLNLYAASKHAVTALTETLRQEFNNKGLRIKVTSISPGIVTTDMVKNGFAGAQSQVTLKWAFLNPEDVANAIVYVLSTPPHVQVHELTIKPVGEIF